MFLTKCPQSFQLNPAPKMVGLESDPKLVSTPFPVIPFRYVVGDQETTLSKPKGK